MDLLLLPPKKRNRFQDVGHEGLELFHAPKSSAYTKRRLKGRRYSPVSLSVCVVVVSCLD